MDFTSWWQQLLSIYHSDLSVKVSVYALAIIFLYFLITWFFIGRDPKPLPKVYTTEPPQGLAPAYLGYIQSVGWADEGINRNFIATLVNMARKGAIKIDPEHDSCYWLIQVDETVNLDMPERAISNTLFASKKRVALRDNNGGLLIKAKDAFLKAMMQECDEVYLKPNLIFNYIGGFLTLIYFFGLSIVSYDKSKTIMLCLWLGLWTLGTVGTCGAFLKMGYDILKRKNPLRLGKILIVLFCTAFIVLGEALGFYFLWEQTSFVATCLFIIIILINILFLFLLKRPTLKGQKVQAAIMGFQDYLMSEAPSFNQKYPADMVPTSFEKNFPYAIALGVANPWASLLIDALASATFMTSEKLPDKKI